MKRAGLIFLAMGGAAWAQGMPMPGQPEAVPLAPIDPPVPLFPYPTWMIASAGVVAVGLLGLLIWGMVAWVRRRPALPPPTPREVAREALTNLRQTVRALEPYPFSVEVSNVLRKFATAQYGVEAVARTSPEFLAAVAGSDRFTEGEKALLAVFLEKSDLIKYARVQATEADSEQLLDNAIRFVEGEGEA